MKSGGGADAEDEDHELLPVASFLGVLAQLPLRGLGGGSRRRLRPHSGGPVRAGLLVGALGRAVAEPQRAGGLVRVERRAIGLAPQLELLRRAPAPPSAWNLSAERDRARGSPAARRAWPDARASTRARGRRSPGRPRRLRSGGRPPARAQAASRSSSFAAVRCQRSSSSGDPPLITVRGRRSSSSAQSSAFATRSRVSSRGARLPPSSRAIADCVVPVSSASSRWESDRRPALARSARRKRGTRRRTRRGDADVALHACYHCMYAMSTRSEQAEDLVLLGEAAFALLREEELPVARGRRTGSSRPRRSKR